MTDIILLTAVLTFFLIAFTRWYHWQQERLTATITVVQLSDFPSQHLGNQRTIQVFLPPGYAAGEQDYPVLYLNDGQDVEALGLRETLARLIARGQIQSIIAVAISTNDDRLHEYGTAVTCNAQGLGSKAAAYAQFVTTELQPHINQQFRVCACAAQTAILGASLGGLSAFDIVWNHPHLFGTAGVFSGSFWWRAGEQDPHVMPGKFIAQEIVRNGRYHHGQRFWFEAATQDETSDRDGDGVIDAIQDTLALINELEKIGYSHEHAVKYVEVQGGRHNYDTWAAILPAFLTWAFPNDHR